LEIAKLTRLLARYFFRPFTWLEWAMRWGRAGAPSPGSSRLHETLPGTWQPEWEEMLHQHVRKVSENQHYHQHNFFFYFKKNLLEFQ
jgi:hypothetical protein